MPGMNADDAFRQFQSNGGEYGGGWNNPNAFESESEWSRFKDMVPKQAKKDFRAKVAGNENRAIEGMQQGLSREQMGIFDQKENGQALYRRLGAGLGSGLDMGRAYDWGGGTALNVGTSDLAKRGIERRGITGDERQRYADFSAAGSPESYWQQHRGNQISGLLASGAIQSDGRGGYINPGPGGGDHYGANLEGYNLGQNPMGTGRGDPRNTGYTPQTVNPGYGGGGMTGGYTPNSAPATYSTPSMYSPMNGGGPQQPSNMQSLGGGAGGGFSAAPQVSAYGGAAQGAAPMSYGAPQQAYGTPAPTAPGGAAAPRTGGGFQASPGATQQGGGDSNTAYERRPGTIGPFGAPGTGNPSGNSLFPALSAPGSGGPMDPSGANGSGGGQVPGWRPDDFLGQIPMTQSGLPEGMGGFQGYEQTPYGGLLNQMGAGDRNIQDFNLARAANEYGGAQPYEDYLGQRYGDVLGYDFQTGQRLQGQAADTANANSFGMLAPDVSRIMGDTDALSARLKRDVPEGGEKIQAQSGLLRDAGAQIGGLRQNLASEAVQGVGNLMQMKKAFDPGAYTGGAEALLGAYGQGRGQDIGAYGQSLQALLGQRGQDVTWGLGQGNLGLGYANMGQQGQQNAWQNYLTGRGQDMNLYSGTRGQDLNRLSQQEGVQQQQRDSRGNLIGGIAGAAGSIIGGYLQGRGQSGGGGGSSTGSRVASGIGAAVPIIMAL